LAANAPRVGSHTFPWSTPDGDRPEVLLQFTIDFFGIVFSRYRHPRRQERVRTAEFERQLQLIGSLAMLIDLGPPAPRKAISVEQAVSTVPEPDNSALADLHSFLCKFRGGVVVPLLAKSWYELLCCEPFDRF